jgi:DNA-directed RNA polymerase specialized sigma24 family protein
MYTPEVPLPEPTRDVDPLWLEPFPDALLSRLPESAPGPEAALEQRDSLRLAFMVAVHNLPPRQRAVLVLRDVLTLTGAEISAVTRFMDTGVLPHFGLPRILRD